MNRAYQLIWNEACQTYAVAHERAKAGGKRGARLTLAAALLMGLIPALSQAGDLPAGGTVVQGSGSISQTANNLTVNQASQNLLLNWQSFNIAAGKQVQFVQPSATSVAVNQVLGSDPTQIFGNLSANGQVFLINPNGVLFGKGASVDVGGLVASTLKLQSNTGSQLKFAGSTGKVDNQGSLTAASGGYIALLGQQVSNEGTITAQLGTAALAAGGAATLNFVGNRLLSVQVDAGQLGALASNHGLIQADGGAVLMTAATADKLLDTVVNNDGVIEARSLNQQAGTIKLLGGFNGGTVQVGGTLDASAPQGGDGGQIETSGAHVKVSDGAAITTLAAQGQSGTWLIDPADFTVAATGGDMTGATLSTSLTSGNVTLSSDAGTVNTAGSGDVNVNDNVSWSANTQLTLNAQHNVNVNSVVAGSGNTAGLVLTPNFGGGSGGVFILGSGGRIDLTGSAPSLQIAGTNYTVINNAGGSAQAATALQNVKNTLTANVALGNDVDLSSIASFVPIGQLVASPFTGQFDGLGHSIAHLTIGSGNALGLFGYNSGSLRDVSLTSVAIVGGTNLGALAGVNNSLGTIQQAHADGVVTSNTSSAATSVGGLVGYNTGSVSTSSAAVTVTTLGNYAGGLIGAQSVGGSVRGSSATGTVNGMNDVGGLIGGSDQGGLIDSSYATGNVSGAIAVGGLVGLSGSATTAGTPISNSYATGTVTGNNNFLGGLVGSTNANVSNSSASGTVLDNGSSAHQSVGGLIGYSSAATTNSHATGAVTNGTNLGRYTGGLIGWLSPTGAVDNSYATGAVDGGNGVNVGGLVGWNQGHITNSDAGGSNAVKGDSSVGGLVGQDSGGTVSTSYAERSVTGRIYVGGLVGANDAAIDRSYATGDVNGSSNDLGGLVGIQSSTGSVSGSYASGAVTGVSNASNYLGGLIGNNAGNITNAYSTGAVSGHLGVGGLVGVQTAGAITNTYATGQVAYTDGQYVGGLIARQDGGSLAGSYWDTQTTGLPFATNSKAAVAGATGGTTAQLMTQATYSGWDFSGTWWMVDGKTRPFLQSEWSPTITNAHQLQLMAMNLSANYRMAKNIDLGPALGSASGMWSSAGFVPVGSDISAYSGTFDGQDHTISNLTITDATDRYVGLFGVSSGILSNIGLVNASISGALNWNRTGVLSGESDGIVTQAFATGAVHSDGGIAGGLVGYNGGQLLYSYADTFVSGGSDVGGLAGGSKGVAIKHCHATGTVTGTGGSVGGLIGAVFMQPSIDDVYATGDVHGVNQVGGLFGTVSDPMHAGKITHAHASGAVSGDQSVGGLIGSNGDFAAGFDLSDSYATGSVSATNIDSRAGGLIGDSYSVNVYRVYATGAVTGYGSIGGLFGVARLAYIGDAYSSGSVHAGASSADVGGLVGLNGGAAYGGYPMPSSITRAYATGAVTAGSGSVNMGGLVGEQTAGSTTSVSYWDTQKSGQSVGVGLDGGASTGVVGGTTSQLMSQSFYSGSGWDFTNVWRIYDGYSTPLLKSLLTPLIVTADGATKTYDGNSWSGGSGVTYSTAPDMSHVLGSVAYAGNSQGAKNGGFYAITPSGLYSSDQQGYDISYASGALTIAPKALTLTGAVAQNKVYDGTPDAVVTGGSLSGVIGGDVVGVSASGSFADKNVGHDKPVMALLTGADAGNYVANVPGGLKADITPLVLTASATAKDKVYDGTKVATVTGGALNNVLPGDTVNLVLGSASFADKNVGTAKSVTVTGSSLSGADALNYTVTEPSGLAANITLAPLTVTGQSAANKSYDGKTTAALSGGSLSGVFGSDAVTLVPAATGNFASKNVGTAIAVTVVGDSLSGADAGNYSLVQPTGLAANITPATLSVTGAAAQNKVYNGSTAATVTGGALNGVLPGETVGLTLGTASFADKNVGTAKAVTVTGSSLTGADAGNYVVTNPTGLKADITKLALTSTATAQDKVYDGTTSAPVSGGALVGKIAGDSVALTLGAASFADKNVGAAKIVTVTGSSLTGTDAGNYSVSDPTGLQASISARPLFITANGQTKVYGSIDPSLTYSTTGLVALDTLTGSLGRTVGENVGLYAINIGSLTAPNNYIVTFGGANLRITSAPLNLFAPAMVGGHTVPIPALFNAGGLLATTGSLTDLYSVLQQQTTTSTPAAVSRDGAQENQ